MEKWYQLANEHAVESPAMLLFPVRIRENIRRMIAVAGAPERLRPHVKTHKLAPVVRMQVEAGISAFKCATLREAEMVAAAGGTDVLVAFPLYGPAAAHLFQLKEQYPQVRFATLVDNPAQLEQFEQLAAEHGADLDLYLDLNVGMNRTGIAPGPAAAALYKRLTAAKRLHARGLHVYDGHLHHSELHQRETECARYFETLDTFIGDLKKEGLEVPDMICGGTPTFPVHARRRERSLSPGTLLLWDWRYGTHYRDMDFLHAAVLMCRVVSKPGKDKLCVDLGHKAVGSEMPHPRVHFMGIEHFDMLTHSEEHMVISFPGADRVAVGTCLYAIPIHICPSMALYDAVWAVENHLATERWTVTARGR